MYKRSIRRHHYYRLKKHRGERQSKSWGHELSDAQRARLTRTATPCSCPMCGNPRKFFGDTTRQEIRSKANFEEQLLELE